MWITFFSLYLYYKSKINISIMNIKDKFLELTSRTYPNGTEEQLFPILHSTVDGLQTDEFGNLFIKIGESDVMFTSHLDTATSALSQVTHVFEENIIKIFVRNTLYKLLKKIFKALSPIPNKK